MNRSPGPVRNRESPAEKGSKFVASGGHAPTLATHTGKFCCKLCMRPQADCAICRKILSKGNSKGETGASGTAARDCCPFWSLSKNSTSSIPRSCQDRGIVLIYSQPSLVSPQPSQSLSYCTALRASSGSRRWATWIIRAHSIRLRKILHPYS